MQLRLHVSVLLLALVLVHLALRDPKVASPAAVGAMLGILLASLLAHEIGHCFAARKLEGHAEQIVIWPLGGLVPVGESREPRNELLTAAAGPLANLLIATVAGLGLVVEPTSPAEFLRLINPFDPPPASPSFSWPEGLRWTFWTNWLLALVNLLPAIPLDGARLARAVFWTSIGYASSAARVARLGQATALCLCVTACLVYRTYPTAALTLMMLGIVMFFCARQEAERLHEHDSDEAGFGYDFSHGYTSLEQATAPPRKRGPGPVRKWLANRRADRLLRRQKIEAEEERRVDDVLARLHLSGLESLSAEDRELLARVSARYRNRLRG